MRFLLRRLIFYVVTAWAAITIDFFIPRLAPGDPVQALINNFQLDTNQAKSLYVLFGLDKHKSLWQQYIEYWGQLFRGDFGISFSHFPSPAIEVIGQALPWTLALVTTTTVLAFLLGTLAGAYAGWRRGSWLDGLLPVTTFFSAVPYFWLGIIFIALFAERWALFPAGQNYDSSLVPSLTSDFIGSAIYHSILPAVTIILTAMAGWVLGMRNMMVTVAAEDYVTVAHAKGLSERRVLFSYAARNAVLPNVAGFALALGYIVSGTLLVELVFSYQGIGLVLFQAIGAKDYPVIQGVFLVIVLAVLVENLIADVAYAALDPRTRQEGRA